MVILILRTIRLIPGVSKMGDFHCSFVKVFRTHGLGQNWPNYLCNPYIYRVPRGLNSLTIAIARHAVLYSCPVD